MTSVSFSSQMSHLVQRPDLARSRHGIGAALHPGDRLGRIGSASERRTGLSEPDIVLQLFLTVPLDTEDARAPRSAAKSTAEFALVERLHSGACIRDHEPQELTRKLPIATIPRTENERQSARGKFDFLLLGN